ncbi:PREDICTED: pentraxin-4 [Nanorana parkeri]|uniref:pentraxin-4 n=1 Tax=Nanorana parkeri TaxID=125878 RepID=UPI0008548472|nr:PREDICTED: pentraxin-4 [Nanorana parkeri]
MAGGHVFGFLFLAGFCLHGVYMEQQRVLEQRKPFFDRFRRLEEQFRRFQDMTLKRLQGIAENYNISYNIDARFHHLSDQQQSLAEALNASSDVTQQELNGVKFWLKKVQKKTKKLDLKISSLEGTMAEKNKQINKENKAQDVAMGNFTTLLSNQKRIIYQLVKDKGELQKGMEVFRETVEIQGRKIAELEKQLQNMQQNEILPLSSLMASEINRTPKEKQPDPPQNDPGPITVQQRLLKLQSKHNQRKKFHEEQLLLLPSKNKMEPMAAQHDVVTRNLGSTQEEKSDVQTTMVPSITMGPDTNQRTSLLEFQQLPPPVTDNIIQISAQRSSVAKDTRPPGETVIPLLSTRKPPHTTAALKLEEKRTKTPATICNVHSMLIFPNSSTENYVTFTKGLREPLHELSICSWVKTNASYLGTILSYATEDNDNKLVLHGRNGATYDAFHFVIGDPAFRELPLVPLIDGKWHHTCFIWSSIQGKYWFYVDRRLTSTGSRFQKGYDIPPGGSLVLGQEQDTLGGGFDSSEAFVGSLAGFAMWNRALSPGEVSGIATGKGLPRGTILTLADDPLIHGAVERVDCTCLEHCP